jgi:hydrogenase maturation protease
VNSTVVVGLGQPFAGDDGVGPAVVAALGPCPAHVTVWSTSNALDLTDVMQHAQRVVVVDAALDAGPAGTVRVLDEGALMAGETRPVSSHAVGVRDAVMLARAIHPGAVDCSVVLVVVAVERPTQFTTHMSQPVREAVGVAVERVRALW